MPQAQDIDPSKFMRRGRMYESNVKARNKAIWESKEILAMGKFMEKHMGFNPFSRDETKLQEAAKRFPIAEAGFSWEKVREKMMEADAATAFPGVLRAGVQTIANNSYQTVEVTYMDWVKVIQSKRDTELYAPLQGLAFPSEVGRQEVYPEVGAQGLDISLRNRKYGTMYPVEFELFEDDQTGQFPQQAGLLGEYMAQLMEVISYGKLASVANMAYANFNVPVTETKDSGETSAIYPWCTSAQPLSGGGFNRPTTFTLLTTAALQAGYIGLYNQKNKLGLKMNVGPNRIVTGPNNIFTASVLLNSAFFPSVPSATPGATGGAFSINPVQGLAALTVSRFLFKNDGTCNGDSLAWYLMDDTKPWFISQIREAVIVEQEAPNAGESFNRDLIRFKTRMRGNADFIDPRFAWQGNDGSATS